MVCHEGMLYERTEAKRDSIGQWTSAWTVSLWNLAVLFLLLLRFFKQMLSQPVSLGHEKGRKCSDYLHLTEVNALLIMFKIGVATLTRLGNRLVACNIPVTYSIFQSISCKYFV